MKAKTEENQNQQMRVFLKKSAEQNSHQKSMFKKLLQSGIQIDYRQPAIKRMVSMGIPSQYRNKIWPVLMEDVHGVTVNFYHSLINKAANLISASESDICPERVKTIKFLNSIQHDINRTFPELKIFTKESEQGQALFNIMSAFTVYRQDLGYLQGMSQLAALLLIELPELESFTLFCSLITTDTLFCFYSMDLEQIQKIQMLFENRIKRGDEQLYQKIRKEGIDLKQLLLSWVMTLFTRMMTIDLVSQLWDIILLHGAETSILIEICFHVLSESKKIYPNFSNFEEQQLFQALKSVKFNNYQAFNIITSVRKSYH